jgi:multidrug efflux pump subunit AcrB
MKIAEYALKKSTVLYFATVLLIAGGILSYQRLGRLEDPEFTIKIAVVTTLYPGASALEVEEEITDRLETAIQQLKQLDNVRSISREGVSIIFVEIQDRYDTSELPQIWDELRRKVNDVQGTLPQGTYPSVVNDDFGDVYGVFFALTGEGYDYKALQDYADVLRRELLLCEDVAKVQTWGEQQEVINVELSRSKLAQLGISAHAVFDLLNKQNLVSPAGKIQAGDEWISIQTSGELDSVAAIENLLIPGGAGNTLIRMSDIATVTREYHEPASQILRFNGQPAVGIGVSTVPGGNVIRMGESVRARLTELEATRPLGMELNTIAYQSDVVAESVQNFVVNLLQALLIVVVLLVVFMGLREGLLIGVILLLTILATFIVMRIMHIDLQRISLGALIIALGMLVDNAIVVAEGIVIKMQRGVSRYQAAVETVSETQWPLLGATLIAILAFAAISLSNDVTGEFLSSLFTVIAVSLLLSWVIAITITPLLCVKFLSSKEVAEKDPHDNRFFRAYARFLAGCIHHRAVTLLIVLAMLAGSLYSFRYVDQIFFPTSIRDQFLVDFWLPEGTHIDTTTTQIEALAARLREEEGVLSTATFVGAGAMRFTLTYDPEMPNSSYGQIVASVDDYRRIQPLFENFGAKIQEDFPDAQIKFKKFEMGPGGNSKIELRISGEDLDQLRQLAEEAEAIIQRHPDARMVRHDWRQPVRTVKIEMDEVNARRTGVTRADINHALQMVFSGVSVGIYREGKELIPIRVRAPLVEREEYDQLANVQVMSSVSGKRVPIAQVTRSVGLEWDVPIIRRRNRMRTITAQADPTFLTASRLFNEIRAELEALPLPEGYSIEWGGEYEGSTKAQKKLLSNVPLAFLLMLLISVALFNTLRHPLIIFLGIPLSLIGVAIGLLGFNAPFGFLALLGMLSLSGMLIKNEIVLLDQIELEIRSGKPPYDAIIESAISRVRPVSMAAFTTVLGMTPLIFDPFFATMAITIFAGLSFATLLTLIVVPVLYATFFRVSFTEESTGKEAESLQ